MLWPASSCWNQFLADCRKIIQEALQPLFWTMFCFWQCYIDLVSNEAYFEIKNPVFVKKKKKLMKKYFLYILYKKNKKNILVWHLKTGSVGLRETRYFFFRPYQCLVFYPVGGCTANLCTLWLPPSPVHWWQLDRHKYQIVFIVL